MIKESKTLKLIQDQLAKGRSFENSEIKEQDFIAYFEINYKDMLEILSDFTADKDIQENALGILETGTTYLSSISFISFPHDTMLILFHYLPSPKAINAIANIISYDPKFITSFMNCFQTNLNFTNYFSNLLFSNSLCSTATLRLIESMICIIDSRESTFPLISNLIKSIQTLPFDIQAHGFHILSIVSTFHIEDFYNFLKSNDKLLSNVTHDDALFKEAINFLYQLAQDSPDSFQVIESFDIKTVFVHSISNMKHIKRVCNIVYNCCVVSIDAIQFFCNVGFIGMLFELKDKVSFSVWNDVISLFCLIANDGNETCLGYLAELNVDGDVEECIECLDDPEEVICALNNLANYRRNHSPFYE